MSIEELNNLHLHSLAIQGKYYYGDNGKTYVGTSNGRLQLLTSASDVQFTPSSDITAINTQDAIDSINEDSGVTSGQYGDATHIPKITVDSKGKITDVTLVGISISGGNVVGPSSAISDDIVLFDGVTGELIKDSGIKLSDLVPNTRTLTINGTTYDLSTNRTWTVGQVTSISNSTGISIGGTSTIPIITNTLPDLTLILNNGTGISITGTYPNFTITNTAPSTTSGTVTSVSVTTANGISGTVATDTTTPAISLALGAITPTTVNGITLSGTGTLSNSGTTSLSSFTGSGSSSGSNTGDQTLNGLLPSQTSNANKVLTTDGTNSSWASRILQLTNVTPFTSVSTATDEVAMTFNLTGLVATGDILEWIVTYSQVNGGAALKTWKFWLNNAANISGATQIAQNQTTSSFGCIEDNRRFSILSNTSISGLFGATTATGTTFGFTANATSSTTTTVPTFASTIYLVITVRRANSSDTAKVESGLIRINKA